MTKVRLKYLHCFTDRHGKPHCYFRYRGDQWRLPAPGTEGFASAYDALLARIKTNLRVEFMPGSLAWAIEKFLASPLYNERAETTKRNYRRILDRLRRGWGTGFLRDLEPRHVRTIRRENRRRFYIGCRHRSILDFSVMGIRNRRTWIGAWRRSDA
jgi:hypothetical protein